MISRPSAFTVRPLEPGDLPAALAIQSAAYPPFLIEDEPAFASRLTVAPSYCLAAVRGQKLIAYLLAHGWAAEAPPPLGRALPAKAVSEVLFIHDLAVSSDGRGSGVGRELVAQAFRRACGDGLRSAEPIAVEGAANYWRALGFVDGAASAELAAKVAGYGPEARWMRQEMPCR